MRSASKLIAFAAMALLACGPARAETADAAALMVPVTAFEQAFNAAQWRFPEGVFTPDAVAVDAFAPYRWAGKGAMRTWYKALMGTDKAAHQAFIDAHYHLELGAPLTVRVEGATAYLVVPGIDRWQDKDGSHYEKANWLLTLRKTAAGWRISSHSWTVSEAG